jgi:hypothetical protein
MKELQHLRHRVKHLLLEADVVAESHQEWVLVPEDGAAGSREAAVTALVSVVGQFETIKKSLL